MVPCTLLFVRPSTKRYIALYALRNLLGRARLSTNTCLRNTPEVGLVHVLRIVTALVLAVPRVIAAETLVFGI